MIGLIWLPALLDESIRAVVVDLDGTLYRGVLGEDGPSGIVLELRSRTTLIAPALELRDGGIFLGIAFANQRKT